MWVQCVKQYHWPKSRSGHICQNITWTRPWGLVLYKGCREGQKSSLPTRGWPNQSWGPFGLESAIGFNTPSNTNARRPSQKAREVCHYKLDSKTQAMEWKNIDYPVKKKLSWDIKELLISLKKGATINSVFCCKVLKQNSPYLLMTLVSTFYTNKQILLQSI